MNDENPFPKAGRTPKRLDKLAAEQFAYILIRKSLPPLIQYWGMDYKLPDQEVYVEKADNDMEDEDGSDDDDESSDFSDITQASKRAKIFHYDPPPLEDIGPSTSRNPLLNLIFCRKQNDPADRAELISMKPLEEPQPRTSSMDCRGSPVIQDVESDDSQEAIGCSRAIRLASPRVCASLLRRGMDAILHYRDREAENVDTESSSTGSRRSRLVANTDSSSGSGRAVSVDEENEAELNHYQVEYLNDLRNMWVLILSKRFLLLHLKKLKRWYDAVVAAGHGGSEAHWLIGEGITEILDCDISTKICCPFFRFTLQVLFCQEAGFLGFMGDKIPSIKTCMAYSKFLKELAPFGVRTLSTAALMLKHPAPFTVIMKHSIYLRKLFLTTDHCKPILKCAKKHRWDIKEISILTFKHQHEVPLTESFMFFIFFNCFEVSDVLQFVDKKSDAVLAFPDLKLLHMHITEPSFYLFLFCLQHFMPGIKTEFVYEVHDINLTPDILRSRLKPPVHLDGKGSFYWNLVFFATGHITYEGERTTEYQTPYPRVNEASLWHHCNRGIPNGHLVSELVTKYGCTKLSFRAFYLYLDCERDIFSPFVSFVGNRLTELRITASRSSFHASEFLAVLKACPNLKVFSLEVACFWPLTGHEIINLPHLPELKSFSISANVLVDPDYDYNVENRRLSNFVSSLIMRAPYLSTLELLRTPGTTLTDILRELESNNVIETLVVDFSFARDVINRLGNIVECLPSLTCLMLYRVHPEVFLEIKKLFHLSALRVVFRRFRLVGIEDYV